MSKKVLVIGAGPGGYVAAIRAAQLGGEVTVVEKSEVGGTCLNWGCIPTKSLLQSAKLYRGLQDTKKFGVYCTDWSFRFDKMVVAKNKIVSTQVNGIKSLFRKNKIRFLQGRAKLLDAHLVEVEQEGGQTCQESAEAIIIATGSEALIPKFVPKVGNRILTTTEALDLDEAPQSIVIIGGSVAGCEFASLFKILGSKVTLVEMLPRILPLEDREISDHLTYRMKKEGIEILTGRRVTVLEREYPSGSVMVKSEEGDLIKADYCLLALGRKLSIEGLGLEKVGIRFSPKGVKVNDRTETNVPGIYAIGDVTGRLLLAHWASAQGVVAAENAMGQTTHVDSDCVPSCIFTLPEISSVGPSEEEARSRGLDVRIGKMAFRFNGMANVMMETEGFIKVVADNRNQQIIGVHIIGPHASELIAEGTLAVKRKIALAEAKEIIHAHPTLSESVGEAMLSCFGQAIHAL
jgi:dihydrolipoamide dehydrogenase